MLKIKDDVDLKELEKFGFKCVNIAGKIKYEFVKTIGKTDVYNIKIDDNRVIRYNVMSVHNELSDVIYDLIQANLVEKV